MKILDKITNCQAHGFLVGGMLLGALKDVPLTSLPVPVTALVSQKPSPTAFLIVKDGLLKDLGERGVNSEYKTCTIHVQQRKEDVNGDVR